jgi:uncharacterized protein YjbI with pentapeptide repeats
MGDQQDQTTTTTLQATASACPHPEAVGKRWGDHISEERHRYLIQFVDSWLREGHVGNRKGPFDDGQSGVRLTGADVCWLAGLDRRSDGRVPDLYLGGANLIEASLGGARLAGANMQGVFLDRANLKAAVLSNADMGRASLIGANLQEANLNGADLRRANLEGADLNGADLSSANLCGVDLNLASLRGATLLRANLSGAKLDWADLSSADLRGANLTGANLAEATLNGADLSKARMNADTRLTDATLDSRTRLVDVVWNGVPLTRLNWEDIAMLGDETQIRDPQGTPHVHFVNSRVTRAERSLKTKSVCPTRPLDAKALKALFRNSRELNSLIEYQDAVMANRQVATALRAQGLNEHADRFAYRAQLCQRVVLRRQRKFQSYLGSLLLDLISGYGYRPMRDFITYLLVVGTFALTYYLLGNNANPALDPLGAAVFSITSFHGRGFAPGESVLPSNPLTVIAAGEAIIGLLIEITFIATFTQRFFAR